MIKKLLKVFIYTVLAYVFFALAGYFLTMLLSANKHDLQQEAVMTAAFVTGPLAAIISFIACIFGIKSS